MLRKDSNHANDFAFDIQWIAGERDHVFTPRPFLVMNEWFTRDVVGQIWPREHGEMADFLGSDGDAAVRSVQMRVHSGAGVEFENAFFLVHEPDSRECRVYILDDRLSASLQHVGKRHVRLIQNFRYLRAKAELNLLQRAGIGHIAEKNGETA